MSDLTQVELFWLKKRIENWIRFGRIAQETILDRNRVSFRLSLEASSRSSAGPRMTTARPFHASTFCEQ